MKTKIGLTILLFPATVLLASDPALAACYQDGDIVTVTGIIIDQPIELANGSKTSAPVLKTTKPICVIQENFGESPDVPANVSRLQLLGKNPVYGVMVELKGRIRTGGVSQYYAVPNALEVISGRKANQAH